VVGPVLFVFESQVLCDDDDNNNNNNNNNNTNNNTQRLSWFGHEQRMNARYQNSQEDI
jgi:hypothetical protein